MDEIQQLEIKSLSDILAVGWRQTASCSQLSNHWHHRLCAAAVGVWLVCCSGCLTHRAMIDQAHLNYWQGDYVTAQSRLQQALKRPKRDASVLKLDQAMAYFSQGDLNAAATLLREVRDQFDEPPLVQTAQNAAAYLTDDNSRPYVGEDHEKILVRVLLTLIDLIQESGDALAYTHQLGQSIDELLAARGETPDRAEKPVDADNANETALPPADAVVEELALAPLLRALVRKSSPLHQDDVLRHLQVAGQWRPTSSFLSRELAEVQQRQQLPPGHGSVYLIALVGRGPSKESVAEPVTSQSLLIADRILSAVGEYDLPPTLAPVKIPQLVPGSSNVDALLVSTGGQVVGRTETIADINRLALERHRELLPQIVARAVARRVIKKSVVVATKSHLNVQSDLVSTAYNVAGVVWEATEQADLRCWSLLPGQVQIVRLDLPVGEHEVLLYPTRYHPMSGQHVLAGNEPIVRRVNVRDGMADFEVVTVTDTETPGTSY